jgi:prepilin-type processing-associated H-X9-DG protein
MVELDGQKHPHIRSYALNSYVGSPRGADAGFNSGGHVTFLKTGDLALARSSETLAFVETAPGNVCVPAFVIGLGVYDGCFFHLPSAQHGGQGVVSFVDGHAEAHRWVEPETVALARTDWLPDHLAHWLYDNRDRHWIRDRASVRR